MNMLRERRHRKRVQVKQKKTPMKILRCWEDEGDEKGDIATVSQAGYEHWRESRNGTLGGAKQNKAIRTSWWHPFLWPAIDAAMRKADWSSADALKILQRKRPEFYGHLNRGTIWKWKERGERAWSAKTCRILRSGMHSWVRADLVPLPNIRRLSRHQEQFECSTNVRIHGECSYCPFNHAWNHPVEDSPCTHSPILLLRILHSRFFQSVMNWSPRAGTRAAAHLPPDADELCEHAFFRLVYCMKWENIPPKLVINGDQQGIYVLPTSSKTFHTKADRQVDIVAKDEKRAFTLFVASTASGDILPFQLIWGGKTSGSLPSKSAPGMDEALERGFHFTVAASETSPRSHFSTLKTMKEWIKEVIWPYVRSVIETDPDLDDNQKAILYIDIYPVHTSKPFRAFVFDDFPNLILIFVPGNTTGKFQPADVGLQCPIKHKLKTALFEWMVLVHSEKLAAGAKPEEIKMSTSLPVLRDASVAGLVKTYDFMQGPDGCDLIKKAWAKSTAKQYNLSAECLNSKQSQAALNHYLKPDTTLHDEIQARCGRVLGIDDGTAIESNPDFNSDIHDDRDVPFSEVVAETFQERPADGNGVLSTEDGLVSGAEGENLWAYNDNGNLWTGEGNLPEEDN
ncbi:hypothetical protein BT96DRAFT_947016 [Gymnopus androsaceus JB14]|uniref:DDE-1 domain-containing protein n=1 Tax=Gymnopus androsaceus JB14 TaxID=1447944 RepID=A0A6A4GU02_9AGAR|nr:hypothetical protein BT96DRAFT_947016 [Gymnopus androsaceus JB14]